MINKPLKLLKMQIMARNATKTTKYLYLDYF